MLYLTILAILLAAAAFLIYRQDKMLGNNRVLEPTGWRDMKLVEYMNSKHNWNSWGHVLVEFLFTSILLYIWPSAYALFIPIVGIVFIELVLQKSKLRDQDTRFDIFTNLIGVLAAAVLYL